MKVKPKKGIVLSNSKLRYILGTVSYFDKDLDIAVTKRNIVIL